MKKILTVLAAVGGLVLAGPAAAEAATVLEGGATDEGTHVKLVADLSDTATTNDFSVLKLTGVDLKLGDLETLSAEYNVTDDDCANASPRYVLTLDDGTFVHVAFGPAPSFTDCAKDTWLSTGNLVGQLDGCRWHSTGTVGDPCLSAEDLEALAGKTVTEAWLVVDASWNPARLAEPEFADKEQTVLVRNLSVDGETELPTGMNPAQTCRALRTAMGEQNFRNAYGTNRNKRNAFGKCVSGVARAKGSERREVANASAACRAERNEGVAAFLQRYRNFGRCVAAKSGTNPTATAAKAKGKGKGKARRP